MNDIPESSEVIVERALGFIPYKKATCPNRKFEQLENNQKS
jgi:hypothetical protein